MGERKVFKRGEYMTVYKLVTGRELGKEQTVNPC